jgi:hypothetical protein
MTVSNSLKLKEYIMSVDESYLFEVSEDQAKELIKKIVESIEKDDFFDDLEYCGKNFKELDLIKETNAFKRNV